MFGKNFFSAVLYDFSKLLEELVHSADRSLSPGLETNAKLMYKKMIRTSTDPYKRYDIYYSCKAFSVIFTSCQ